MLKIKMHAMYDHFPDHNPDPGEPHIDCYSDTYVEQCTTQGKNIALLLEPASMIGPAYRYVMDHLELFRYVFTHEAQLLRMPNTYYLNWADVWLQTDSEKNKGISLCTSYKDWCELHKARLTLAKHYEGSGVVDVYYGDWNNPRIPNIPAQDYLEHYKYSIIIENDIDDLWFTEKILNCFATKTIPIYVGAPKIGELFNPYGIIQVSDWHDIPDIISNLDIDTEYIRRLDAINDNYKRIKPYQTPWKTRFFNDYGALLEDLQNER